MTHASTLHVFVTTDGNVYADMGRDTAMERLLEDDQYATYREFELLVNVPEIKVPAAEVTLPTEGDAKVEVKVT